MFNELNALYQQIQIFIPIPFKILFKSFKLYTQDM